MKIVKSDWHNYDRYLKNNSNWCYYDKCSCSHYCSDKKADSELIIEYIFKQHLYTLRLYNGGLYTWVHLSQTNSNSYVNNRNPLIASANVLSKISTKQRYEVSKISYPDYSGVDVGKGIKWPTNVFAPYVDATAWPPFQLADMSDITGVLYYNLGFIVSESPTVFSPSWGGYYQAPDGPLNDQIKKLREKGGDVTISFGGAANVPLQITAPDAESLFMQYKLFAEGYGLTRIDFDIEGTWISTAYDEANIRNSQALKMLQDYYKSIGSSIDIWFTLPILPTGLTSDGINLLTLLFNAGVELSGVNAMTMDYGEYAAPNPEGRMGEYGIEAIKALKSQLKSFYGSSKTDAELWAMIGTTPMIGKNDVQGEVFTQDDARQTLSFANQVNVGMISMWSSNRDNSSGSGITQKDNEFSEIFNQYNN